MRDQEFRFEEVLVLEEINNFIGNYVVQVPYYKQKRDFEVYVLLVPLVIVE